MDEIDNDMPCAMISLSTAIHTNVHGVSFPVIL